MNETETYPPIDPSNFDLILVGTGIPESILAAAASAAGKSVLHLDPNSFYGTHFSSLSLDEFSSFLRSESTTGPSCTPQLPASNPDSDFIAVGLEHRCLYSDFEISTQTPGVLELSRNFNLDLAGPRALLCADSTVDLFLRSGVSQYLEFKSIDASFVYDGMGGLSSVPDSRAGIFKDRTLRLTEKNLLMRFFKLVQDHLGVSDSDGAKSNDSSKISEEDLESPFVEFMEKMRLPPKIKSIILYAIALADYDQDNMEASKDILKTKDGIDRLALYHSSIGRFPNALGAMIYPIYGQGELPQAFCRRAAVKGCIYVLRMPVSAVLMDKHNGKCKGVRLGSGQDIFSHHLVVNPSFTIPRHSVSSVPKGKVARAVCITSSSLKSDVSNFLVVYPPRSLHSDQVTAIRSLQIGSNLAVCPSGLFVLYFSTLCDDANQGKKLLLSAMTALFTLPISGEPENHILVQSDTEVKPSLLWSALYIQDLTTTDMSWSIYYTPMPDGNLNYKDLVDATTELFHHIYPDEEFFPMTTASESAEDDDVIL